MTRKIAALTSSKNKPPVVDFVIQPDAPLWARNPFVGATGWMYLVRCSDGKHEWVPQANTRLEEHMRITAVISPEASSGLEILREGCEATKREEEAKARTTGNKEKLDG